jgi:hypothetical protein
MLRGAHAARSACCRQTRKRGALRRSRLRRRASWWVSIFVFCLFAHTRTCCAHAHAASPHTRSASSRVHMRSASGWAAPMTRAMERVAPHVNLCGLRRQKAEEEQEAMEREEAEDITVAELFFGLGSAGILRVFPLPQQKAAAQMCTSRPQHVVAALIAAGVPRGHLVLAAVRECAEVKSNLWMTSSAANWLFFNSPNCANFNVVMQMAHLLTVVQRSEIERQLQLMLGWLSAIDLLRLPGVPEMRQNNSANVQAIHELERPTDADFDRLLAKLLAKRGSDQHVLRDGQLDPTSLASLTVEEALLSKHAGVYVGVTFRENMTSCLWEGFASLTGRYSAFTHPDGTRFRKAELQALGATCRMLEITLPCFAWMPWLPTSWASSSLRSCGRKTATAAGRSRCATASRGCSSRACRSSRCTSTESDRRSPAGSCATAVSSCCAAARAACEACEACVPAASAGINH